VRLFGDEDGETHEVYVAAIAFVAEPLTDAQAAALGGPQAAGVFAQAPPPGDPGLRIAREGGNVRLSWDGAPERLLERSESMATGAWGDLPATLGLDSYVEAIDEGADVYFRVMDQE
jgi:hypothetical protein